MSKIYLQNKLACTKELHIITDMLKKWDYSLVEGEGLYYSMTGKYGHIKINISKNEETINSDYLINNLTETQLPLDYLDEVVDVLQFFSLYVRGIKGENIGLKFEIKDSSFHIVDSKRFDFQVATFWALVNCFDKTKSITEEDKQRIRNYKNLMKV